jgi:protein ImuB
MLLPRLPLEVFSRGAAYPDPCPAPCVVAENSGNTQQVSLCNDTASDCGIRPGMKLGAARALAANLVVFDRDPELEAEALKSVATWAGQFSSYISLADSISGPDAVLLEVEGSVKLFGDLSALLQQAQGGIAALGYDARLAVAPTPLASRLLARSRWLRGSKTAPVVVTQAEKLIPSLGRLPVSYLEFDNKTAQALSGMGIDTIADCLRLPRDGLARRFGKAFLYKLDRLTGKLADPLPAFTPPHKFYSRIDLPAEVEEVEALLFALQRLLLELQGFLLARGAGVQQLDIELKHRGFVTRLSLAMLTPGRNSDKLLMLARERFARLQLEAPVLEIAVRTDTVCELEEATTDLFGHGKEEDNLLGLLERLRARLGNESVQGVYPIAEHRPECAWRFGEPGERDESINDNERPLWILPTPMRLQQKRGRPMLHGQLHLYPDRERIESGWWDGGDVRRDYFIAHDYRQSRYWIFRDLDDVSGNWYLHGIFE